MLLVTVISLFWIRRVSFPIIFWLPWVFYIVIYLILDFSFLGLQLTLQYILPLLIGIVASGFIYREKDFRWMIKWFMRLIAIVYALFVISKLFGSGYPLGMAMMPMIFSIAISLFTALFIITREKKYLLFAGILFIAPVVMLTRMGIAATSAVFILHFANRLLKTKLIFGVIGISALLLVFSSKGFQKATFYGGEGKLRDVTFNYYDNPVIRSSGRISWKKALEPGLKNAPVWGNGPRADNIYLTKITRMKGGEAHNDYLSVRFNYGYVGLTLLLLGFASSFIYLYGISLRYRERWYLWLISTSVLTLYFAFLMFMYTDNILKYTVYFPNYFFAMTGIVYSLKSDEDISSDTSLQ